MIKIDTNRHYVHRPANKLTTIFRFSGTPFLDQFEEAIRAGMKSYEILRSRIVLAEDGSAYYEENPDKEPVVKLNVEKYEKIGSDEEDVETMLDIAIEWAQEEIATPLAIHEGELMHHGIFTDGVETVWVISSHYLAGDAESIQFLAKNILKAYEKSEEELKDHKYKPENFDAVKGFKSMNFIQRHQIKSLDKKWRKTARNKSFSVEDFTEMNEFYHSRYKQKFLCEYLDKPTTQRLLKNLENTNIRLEQLIPAAFKVASQENETLTYIVSTREEGYKGVGVYGGSYTLSPGKGFSVSPDLIVNAEEIAKSAKSLENNQKAIQRSNLIVANLNGNLIDSAYYSAFGKYRLQAASTMQKMFSLTRSGEGMQINNLQELPQKHNFSFGELEEVYYVPAILPNFRRALAFHLYRGKLYITSSFYQDDKAEHLIFNRALDELRDFAEL